MEEPTSPSVRQRGKMVGSSGATGERLVGPLWAIVDNSSCEIRTATIQLKEYRRIPLDRFGRAGSKPYIRSEAWLLWLSLSSTSRTVIPASTCHRFCGPSGPRD